MGLDAYVTCRCWQDGKVTPPAPVVWDDELQWVGPADGLTRDEVDAVCDWRFSSCGHEEMEAVAERIGNWAGVNAFADFLERQPPGSCPELSREWDSPIGNGGWVPVARARRILTELDHLESTGLPEPAPGNDHQVVLLMIARLRRVFSASVEVGNPVVWC